MIKYYFVIFLMLLVYSCKRNKNGNTSEINAAALEVVDNIVFPEFYPVYRISRDSYGIVIKLNDSPNQDIQELSSRILDSTINLFYNKTYNDYLQVVDTTGNLPLFKNRIVTEHFERFIDSSYALYFENSVDQSKVVDVLIHPNECISSFVLLRFNKKIVSDKTPLFASKSNLKFVFKNNEDVKKNIDKKLQSLSNKFLNDSISRIFASYNDTYFLGYNDDFDRSIRKHQDYYSELKVSFPSRIIAKMEDSKIEILQNHELDLYGLPCN